MEHGGEPAKKRAKGSCAKGSSKQTKATSHPASNPSPRPTVAKSKNSLLKIYQEASISTDELKDLGAISHYPITGTNKYRVTLNFKYKRHEPIIIAVEQSELKSVVKRIRDFQRKCSILDEKETDSGAEDSLPTPRPRKPARSSRDRVVEDTAALSAGFDSDYEDG